MGQETTERQGGESTETGEYRKREGEEKKEKDQ